jgi:hypothetical protein
VKISERDASVLLSEEGREVLKQAALNLAESPFLSVKVEDSDDIGIWVRVNREDGDHLVWFAGNMSSRWIFQLVNQRR